MTGHAGGAGMDLRVEAWIIRPQHYHCHQVEVGQAVHPPLNPLSSDAVAFLEVRFSPDETDRSRRTDLPRHCPKI